MASTISRQPVPAASVPTPPSGYFVDFYDSSNSDLFSRKDDTGAVTVLEGGGMDLAGVLAIGNTTGGTDIVVSAGDLITITDATVSEIAGIGASKEIVSLAVATYPSLVELARLKGVTGGVQGQVDAKSPIASPTFTGTLTTPAVIVSSETASKVAIIDASKNVKSADTTTYPSLAELAFVKGTTSAIQTQFDSKLAKASVPCEFIVACSDLSTALTTGTTKAYFRAPYAFTLTAVRASVQTAPTGATLLTIDINDSGTTVLSTKLTFDASEKTTTTATTPAVISDSAIGDDAEITIDIDAVGSTIAGAGLNVTLIGTHSV